MEKTKKIFFIEFIKEDVRILIERLRFLTNQVLLQFSICKRFLLRIFHVLPFEFYKENIRRNVSTEIFHMNFLISKPEQYIFQRPFCMENFNKKATKTKYFTCTSPHGYYNIHTDKCCKCKCWVKNARQPVKRKDI